MGWPVRPHKVSNKVSLSMTREQDGRLPPNFQGPGRPRDYFRHNKVGVRILGDLA